MLDFKAPAPEFPPSPSAWPLSGSPLSPDSPDETSMAEIFGLSDDVVAQSLDALDSQSPDEDGKAFAQALGGKKTKMSLEEKKRRNRDCMRRLRDRRTGEIATMREEVSALEAALNAQLEFSSGSGNPASGDPVSGKPASTVATAASHGRLQSTRRLEGDHAYAKQAIRRLREENYWLQKQISKRQESLDAVQQILQERAQACPAIDVDALEEEDIGVWIRNTDHFFPPLEDARAFEIVMDSYRIIQEGIRISQKLSTTTNAVLGWADQRSVDKQWANFIMQKTFAHENPRQLALKTWQMLSAVAEINLIQPMAHEMKVLQRLNDSTLVIARHTYFKSARVSYCTLYLLFMIETDNGVVIGTRSLDPDEEKMKVFTSERMTVAKPFHSFHFQEDAATGGARLTFAGRVDNIQEGYAKNCAMDMLLAMMRWESHCVSPLWRLAC